jgi:spermidine/putrescine ABC transporter ATP-binding subunit
MAEVRLKSVVKRFGDLIAVNDVSYKIQNGEFFTIVGPSGCGKTTTLRMIAGFDTPTSGTIEVGGNTITDEKPEDRDIGMVFQDYALFPHMTAYENIQFGLKMNEVDSSYHDTKINEMLELIDLPDIGKKYPEELSGGQQQRVALARALVIEPDVLLLDEPLSNLDKKLRDQMQIELKRIQKEAGVTTIHVTHNQTEAMSLADNICVMNDGTVEQIGSPKQVYHNPQNKFVANFLGESNQLDAKLIENNNNKSVAEINESGIRFSLINGTKSNSRTGSVVFRPEDIEFGIDSDQKNTFDAYIETSLFTGGKTRCEIALEGGSKIIAFSNKFREPDSSVTVTVPPEKVQFIAGD